MYVVGANSSSNEVLLHIPLEINVFIMHISAYARQRRWKIGEKRNDTFG